MLIFAGIPAAVIAVVTGVVYASGAGASRRYRPGRPFEFAPVWFLSAPESLGPESLGPESPGLESSGPDDAETARGELPAGVARQAVAAEWPAEDPAQRQVTGGASDRW